MIVFKGWRIVNRSTRFRYNQRDIFEQNDKQKKEKFYNKIRQITQKGFSKRRNAVSESETSNLDGLCKLKDSVNKNYPVNDQL